MNPLKSSTTWDAFFGGVLNTNKLCPALVSLVFLQTFFGLAQFYKKPCNPVFNVLQVFKKICRTFCCKVRKDYLSPLFRTTGEGYERTTWPGGNVVLTTSNPSNSEEEGVVFQFIADRKSKTEKIKKPCGRTTQFSAGLHCQRETSAGQCSLGGV